MNAEMKEAEKHLTGMEKWCGLCICPWNRRPKVRDVDGTWQSSSKVACNKNSGKIFNSILPISEVDIK